MHSTKLTVLTLTLMHGPLSDSGRERIPMHPKAEHSMMLPNPSTPAAPGRPARHGNDRLLLGLKGSLHEYQLDLLRQRSLSARYEKARRDELVVSAPVGFVKAGDWITASPAASPSAACASTMPSRMRS
jgi:hypothetical protein